MTPKGWRACSVDFSYPQKDCRVQFYKDVLIRLLTNWRNHFHSWQRAQQYSCQEYFWNLLRFVVVCFFIKIWHVVSSAWFNFFQIHLIFSNVTVLFFQILISSTNRTLGFESFYFLLNWCYGGSIFPPSGEARPSRQIYPNHQD